VRNMNEKQYIEFLEDLNKKIIVLTNELENITHVQGGNKNE